VLVQVRWLRNSRPSGTQTCSPSPCLQQGANLTLPVRLRRQQGAHPGTASALVTPLEACHGPAAAACHPLSNHHSDSVSQPAAVACCQRGEKGLGRHLAGRLVGAEKHSVEVGARSARRQLACRGCLSAADAVSVVSSPAPPRREHRKAVPLRGTTNIEARTDAGPALAPRCIEKALHPTPERSPSQR
jgi:hypothetical protein